MTEPRSDGIIDTTLDEPASRAPSVSRRIGSAAALVGFFRSPEDFA